MKKPLILVTNDDGISAPGMRALIEVASQIGEVVIVAPDSPQSGQGHAITLKDPIRVHKASIYEQFEAYECSGTPVDCVKFARDFLLKDRKVDLCVSGINHGSNASINIIYSGTMSAAMEASLSKIDSIGFSLLDYSWDADFDQAKPFIEQIIRGCLEHKLEGTNLLNVNIPNLKREEIKGIKVCKQADAKWSEEYVEATDPRGGKYYWLTGEFNNYDERTDTDLWALDNGYISVVPSQHDLTAYTAMDKLDWIEK